MKITLKGSSPLECSVGYATGPKTAKFYPKVAASFGLPGTATVKSDGIHFGNDKDDATVTFTPVGEGKDKRFTTELTIELTESDKIPGFTITIKVSNIATFTYFLLSGRQNPH